MDSDSTPHDYLDTKMIVEGLASPADEQKLNSALNRLSGVRAVNIAGANVSVEYDPIEVSKHEIGEVITRMGFKVVDVETAAASPLSDALHGSE